MRLARFFLPLTLLYAVSSQAMDTPATACDVRNEVPNLLTDVIFVRPVGVVGTLVGSALFIGLSPLTGLASIVPPHDAFQKVAAVLVGVPYDYTFVRPLGQFGNTCY